MTRVGTRLSIRERQATGHRESRSRSIDAASTIDDSTADRCVFGEDPQVAHSIESVHPIITRFKWICRGEIR